MKWKTTVFLGLLLLAAVALWKWGGSKPRRETEEIPAGQKLLPPGVKIRSFWLITRSDSFQMSYDDSAGGWELIYPTKYPADQSAVESVLTAAKEAYYEKVVAVGADPADFGLAPKPWVRFITGTHRFDLGDRAPSGEGVYGIPDGRSEIVLVPEKFRRTLLKVSTDLRDRTIIPNISLLRTDSVFVIKNGDTVSLARRGFVWEITRPFSAPADGKMVEQYLTPLLNLSAIEFPAEDHSPATLKRLGAKKLMTAKIFFTDTAGTPLSQTVNFWIKPFEGDTGIEFIFAAVPDKRPLFEVGSDVLNLVDIKPGALRERNPLSGVVDADKIRITGPEGFNLVLRLEPEGWFVVVPNKLRANDSKVEDFLKMFSAVHIDSILTDTGFLPAGWEFWFWIGDDSLGIELGQLFEDMGQFRIAGKTDEYYLTRHTELWHLTAPQSLKVLWKKEY